MVTRIGIYSLLAGFFVGVFNGISSFMGVNNIWVNLTISKLIGPDVSESIAGGVNIEPIRQIVSYLIYDLPFFCFLLGMGVVFLILSLFVKEH
jgi:hypothetical protein